MTFTNTYFLPVLIALAILLILGGVFFKLRHFSLMLNGPSYILRAIALFLLAVATFGPYYQQEIASQRKTIVLADISESLAHAQASELVKQIHPFFPQLAVLPFSKQTSTSLQSASVLDDYQQLRENNTKLDIGQTDLATALQTAEVFSSTDLILLSDGWQTTNNALSIAEHLGKLGVRIHPLLPPETESTLNQITIQNLHAPLTAAVGASVPVRISLKNSGNKDTSVALLLSQDGEQIFHNQLEVAAHSSIVQQVESKRIPEGFAEIIATITAVENESTIDSERIFVAGRAREKILLISSTNAEAKLLKDVLKTQSYQLVDQVTKNQRLASLPAFDDFSAVILNNVAHDDLPSGSASTLQQYVHAGGGLIMVGGNRSFGLGGYRGTALERALPVELLQPQKETKRLNIAVQLVLDKSGSMQQQHKLEFLQLASAEVIKALKDEDLLGILVFDNSPWIVLPIDQLARTRQKALDRLKLIFAQGKTNLLPAIGKAREQLERAPAGRKHMIILTDGEVPNAYQDLPYYQALVKEMRLAGITVSTFMLGSESDFLLAELAHLGGGAFHRTTDPRSLPRLFLDDLKVAVGEHTQREDQRFEVRLGTGNLKSTNLRSFPPVLGYVQTKSKPAANLELVASYNGKASPLLVSWNYGQGRSIAFTSDSNGRWSYYWARWEQFYHFWTGLIDSLRPEKRNKSEEHFDLRYAVESDHLQINATVYSGTSAKSLSGQIVLPDGSERTIAFSGLARGNFQAKLPNIIPGRYELRLFSGSKTLTPVAFYLSGELFGEQQGQGFNRTLLTKLASLTNGIINPSPQQLGQGQQLTTRPIPLAPYFCLAALVFLLVEILWRNGLRLRRFTKH